MSEYSLTDWNLFGRSEINRILRQTCSDYISNADNPTYEIRRYFTSDCFSYNEYERQIIFLQHARVRDDEGNYINGFTDNPYSDFKIFKGE